MIREWIAYRALWLRQLAVIVVFLATTLGVLSAWTLTLLAEPDAAKVVVPLNGTVLVGLLVTGLVKSRTDVADQTVSLLKAFLAWCASNSLGVAIFSVVCGAMVAASVKYGPASIWSDSIGCGSAVQVSYRTWQGVIKKEECSTNKMVVVTAWAPAGRPKFTCRAPTGVEVEAVRSATSVVCASELDEELPVILYGYLVDAKTQAPLVDAKLRVVSSEGGDLTTEGRWLTDSRGFYVVESRSKPKRSARLFAVYESCDAPAELALTSAHEIKPDSGDQRSKPLFKHFVECKVSK